jgi:hypothetical protein
MSAAEVAEKDITGLVATLRDAQAGAVV